MITQYQNYQQPTSLIEKQDLHTSHLIQNQSDSEHSYSNDPDKSPSKSKHSSTIHSKTKTERKSKRNSRKCGELIKNLKWSTFLNQADTNNNNNNTSIIDNIEDMFDNPKPSESQYNNNNNQDNISKENISINLNQNNNKGNNNNNKLISNCDIKITNKKSHTPISNKRKDNSTNVDVNVDVNSIQKYKQYKIKKEYHVYKHNNHNNDINKSMFLFKNKIKFYLEKVTPKKLNNSFITKMKFNYDNQTTNNKKEPYINKEIKQNITNDIIHNTKNDTPNENNDKLYNNINHNNVNNNNDNSNNNYETIKPKQPLLSKVITNKSKINKALHYKPTPLLHKQINNLPLNPIKKKEQTHNNTSHKHSLSPRTTDRNNNKSNLNINTTNSNTSNLIHKLPQFKPKQLKQQQQPYPKIPFANASFHSINNAPYLPRSASSKQLTNTTNTSLPTQTKATNSLRKPFTGITQDYIDKKKQFFMGLLKDPSNPYSICWSDKILNKGYGVITNVKGTVNCVPNLALINLNNSNCQNSYANNTLYTPADITKFVNKNHLDGERMFSKVDDDCRKKISERTSSCKLGRMNLDKYPTIQKYFS